MVNKYSKVFESDDPSVKDLPDYDLMLGARLAKAFEDDYSERAMNGQVVYLVWAECDNPDSIWTSREAAELRDAELRAQTHYGNAPSVDKFFLNTPDAWGMN